MKRKCLAVGIILLFLGTCIFPAIAQNTEKSSPASRGNWFYVGGSGPGNYTRIQDAIDNASDGDIVYVYPGLYVELLVINRSIDLLGVDKNSTIIDGNDTHLGSAITINKDNVSVTNFTIQNSDSDGIKIYTSDNTISDNIITRNGAGIYLFSHIKNNVFHDNQISHSHQGLELHGGQKTKVTHNFFQDCSLGIELMGSDNTSISWNIFENATNIELYDVTNSTIENNLLISSGTILLRIAKNMEIKNNTFIDSKGIEIIGGNIDCWATHIIENNTMNDKQIYYYRHTSGVVVPSDAGEIILGNCTDFIISHIIFSKGGGIQLGYSSSNSICWNTIDGETNAGIRLQTSSYNNISYNTITNCSDGIKITDDSIENEISRNMIFHNSDDGIYLSHDASDNWIYQNRIENNNYHGIYIAGKSTLCSENHITNNSYGVSLWYTSNTTISRNNFVHNIIHVSFEADYTTSHSNTWDSNFYSPEIPRFLKIIFGNVRTRFYIMVGPMHGQWKEYFYRPGINVDWHPAKEPYDIPEVR